MMIAIADPPRCYLRVEKSRGRDDPEPLPDLIEILLEVSLVVDRHEVDTRST